ncbi:DUF4232 domain-containing protein [Streptomyces griseoviridis]|uniref:DUF4232 domain-containing protein n=1 Tax=Streptomyces griseoviridis TaxID=45398 RepID=A0A3S9ZAY0_STRGD|nr:DUF4232 domain-containing protein [Streptomyces griseoviridis]AZS84978.1 DUF4232 domain-containing protein [Streptomyces griseoviridis]QCN88171.1 DUF4232 domain-containing protein [Streptomyces griseoviridis]
MRAHKLTFAALIVAAGLSLTACQNDDGAVGQSDPSAASTGASASSGTAGSGQNGTEGSAGNGSTGNTSGAKSSGGPGTTTGSGSSGGQSGAEACRTDDLAITAADGTVGGDEENTVAVELRNRGGKDCVISGWAGVDLKTGAGVVSAERAGRNSGPDTLKDGDSTFFGITYPANDSGGSGVRVTSLLVTPPNQTKTVTLTWPGGTLPVTEGGGPSVKVGPMGGVGQGG